jgi:hypothetical protein
VADFLAERGHEVVMVVRSGILKKAVHADRVYFLDRIADFGIDVRTDTEVIRIELDAVVLRGPDGVSSRIEDVGGVALCVGYVAQPDFVERVDLQAGAVAAIGDAVASRKLFEAIEEGTLAGIAI